MEWKRKFYDIVRETESNLTKARRKLYGHGNIEETCSQEVYKLKDPLSSTITSSTPALASWSPVQWRDDSNIGSHHLGSWPTSMSAQSSWEVRSLLEKVDAQNQVIHKMERLLKSLDKERDEYKQQIRDLRNEVGGLVSHVSRTSDLQVETQVDLMRREVMAEIKRLKDMLHEGRSATTYSSLLERGMAKDIRDIKQNIQEELDRVQQEVNQINRRLGKLEVDITAHDLSHRDIHGPEEWTLRESSRVKNSSVPKVPLHQDFSPGFNPVSAIQIEHLRSTVSNLHEKLDKLEGRLPSADSISKQLPMPSNGTTDLGFSPSRKHLAKAHVLDLDDNNCSDLTDLDLSADLDGNSSSIDDDLSDDSDILMPKKTYDIKSHLNTSQRSWKKQTKLQTPASVRVSSPVTGIPSELDADSLDMDSPVDLNSSEVDDSIDSKVDHL